MKVPGLNSQHGTNGATCLSSETTSLTSPFSFARPSFARKRISRTALIEILDAALDLVSSVDEEDDLFMVVAEEKSSWPTKKTDDPESPA